MLDVVRATLSRLRFNPVKFVLKMQVRPKVSRPRMAFEQLHPGASAAQSSKPAALLRRSDFLVGHGPEEFADPESARISRRALCRKDVICSDTLLLS